MDFDRRFLPAQVQSGVSFSSPIAPLNSELLYTLHLDRSKEELRYVSKEPGSETEAQVLSFVGSKNRDSDQWRAELNWPLTSYFSMYVEGLNSGDNSERPSQSTFLMASQIETEPLQMSAAIRHDKYVTGSVMLRPFRGTQLDLGMEFGGDLIPDRGFSAIHNLSVNTLFHYKYAVDERAARCFCLVSNSRDVQMGFALPILEYFDVGLRTHWSRKDKELGYDFGVNVLNAWPFDAVQISFSGNEVRLMSTYILSSLCRLHIGTGFRFTSLRKDVLSNIGLRFQFSY